VFGQVVQQRGLTDTWLPAHHQRLTGACTHRVDELVDRGTFVAPILQLGGTAPLAEGSPSSRQRH
jgi:hypothetical protein